MLLKYIKYELERLNAGVWLGLAAIMATMLVPMAASAAGQITTRSTTLSNSAGAGTGVTYVSTFTVATSGQTLAAFKFEICDSPLSTSACVNTGNSSGATFTPASSASVSGGAGTWALGTHSGNSALVTNSGVTTQTGTPTFTVTINGVTNPTAVNVSYYLRISTYTNTGATTPAYPGTDFGATALATTQTLTVAANVQESLSFCTGTTVATSVSACTSESGSTVNVGTGADNVLSSSVASGGYSTMLASTNAATGYNITYYAPATLTSGANTITAAASTGQTMAACSSNPNGCFGINVYNGANTLPAVGLAQQGSGSGTVTSPYATLNSFAFNGAAATQVASATGPTVSNVYTVSYAAEAGTTSKPGAYSTTFNYICTGNF